MGAGTFSTLQLPKERVETAAVVVAVTLIKFLLETLNLLFVAII
jgi:hypothetical protein